MTSISSNGNTYAFGWVDSGSQTSTTGNPVIIGDLDMGGHSITNVNEISNTAGPVTIDDSLSVNQDLVVQGTSSFTGAIDAQGGVYNSAGILQLNDDVSITGTLDLDTLDVKGHIYNSTPGNPLLLQDDVKITGELEVPTINVTTNIHSSTGSVAVADDLQVTGGVTVGGSAVIGGSAVVGGAMSVGGAASFSGGVSMNGGSVTIDAPLDIVQEMKTDIINCEGYIYNNTGSLTLSDQVRIIGSLQMQEAQPTNSTALLNVTTVNGIPNSTGVKEGSLVYDTLNNNLYYYNGSWVRVATMADVGTPTLANVLLTGNTSGASDLIMSAGRSLSFANKIAITTGTSTADTLIGSTASAIGAGDSRLAIGPGASVGNGLTASYYNLAIGRGALAQKSNGIALGSFAVATETDSIAVGQNASAGHVNSITLGQASGTTADNQIRLGTATHHVSIPGTELCDNFVMASKRNGGSGRLTSPQSLLSPITATLDLGVVGWQDDYLNTLVPVDLTNNYIRLRPNTHYVITAMINGVRTSGSGILNALFTLKYYDGTADSVIANERVVYNAAEPLYLNLSAIIKTGPGTPQHTRVDVSINGSGSGTTLIQNYLLSAIQ